MHTLEIEHRYSGEVTREQFTTCRDAVNAFRSLIGNRSIRHAELSEDGVSVQSYTPGWLDDDH